MKLKMLKSLKDSFDSMHINNKSKADIYAQNKHKIYFIEKLDWLGWLRNIYY